MIKYLRESFRVLVGESDLLDDSTKNKSLEKLDAFVENVGYPDWILDNQQLDNYYNLVNVFQVQDYSLISFLIIIPKETKSRSQKSIRRYFIFTNDFKAQ
jgi:predicted metalloendopeptidase